MHRSDSALPPFRLMILVVSMFFFHACSGAQTTEGCPPPSAVPFDASVGPGDILIISVVGEDELSGDYTVSSGGTIQFPFVNEVQVQNEDPDEISRRISRKLQKGGFFRSPYPQMNVAVKEYRGKNVVVTGSVQRPGTIPMRPGLGAAEAIATAGGVTPLANEDSTVVSREVGEKLCRYRVHATAIREGRERDFLLQPGDRVDVPRRAF